MCQSTAQSGDAPLFATDHDWLRIRSFRILFSLVARRRAPLPVSLTLVYLPRISGGPLEINDAKIPDSTPAFVALHRLQALEAWDGSEAAFGSTDRIRAGEGVNFDVYAGTERILRGVFRRGLRWVVDCQVAQLPDLLTIEAAAAKICVVMNGGAEMRDRVLIKVGRWQRRRCKHRIRFCSKLEEIPEEGEVDVSNRTEEETGDEPWGKGGADCWDTNGSGMRDDGYGVVMEGVGWAVDVGILVACLGVGLLMSRCSFKRLRIF